MTTLVNKIIWLTGASQGIGASLAGELVGRGARVAMTARSVDSLSVLQKRYEGHAFSFPGDRIASWEKVTEVSY